MPIAESPDPDMTAAELALGLLEGEERAAAMRRVLADPAFAREVSWWHDRLAAMFAWWPDAAPPPEAEDRIMAAVAPAAAAAHVGRWRAATMAFAAIAAALLGVVALRPAIDDRRTPAPPPTLPAPAPAPLAAAIAPEAKTPPVPAVYDPASGALRVAVAARLAPARRSPQLWVIDLAGTPHSLAVLSNGRSMTVTIPPALRRLLEAGATLAISIEPAGGAPGKLPTGPVVATGPLTRL